MNGEAIRRGLASVRASDWWGYKIPPLLAIAFAACLVARPGPGAALATIAGTLAAICTVAAYGYIINDVFDIDEDRRSGKPNRMAGRSPATRALLLAICVVAGFALIAATSPRPASFVLLGVNYLLPTLYSLSGIRLKERGVFGVLADAGAAHAVPTALTIDAIGAIAGAAPLEPWFVTPAIAWPFLAGLRGIIVHQVRDARADTRAGVVTFGRAIGAARARRLVLAGLLPIEAVSLGVFLAIVLPVAPVALILLLVHAVLEAVKIGRGWRLPLFDTSGASTEPYIPLLSNASYEMWLPLAFAVQLMFTAPLYVALPPVMVLAFLPNYRQRTAALLNLFRRARPHPAGGRSESPREAAVPRPSREIRSTPGRSSIPPVIVGATSWTVNGVNVFSMNLVRGLRAAGVPAHVLLTEEGSDAVLIDEPVMPRPNDVPFEHLPVRRWDGWGAHWGAMVRYLEERAPCIYIPNSDWRHSCVIPRLPDGVTVVGIVHSDDPLHYDHVARLGAFWDAVVAVSRAVSEHTLGCAPGVSARLFTIPIGANVPAEPPARPPREGATLRLIYHGTLKQHQKRVLDLPAIVAAAAARGAPVHLTIAGAGPDERRLRDAAQPLVEQGLVTFAGLVPPDDVPGLLERHEVYVLASEFEGMPNALIEAMGRGCVPIVTRMTSGVPELVEDRENGFVVPIGDASAFADRLALLAGDPACLARMSQRAYDTVARGSFRVEDMVRSYLDVFAWAADRSRPDRFVRPVGEISPPPESVSGVSLFPIRLIHHEPGVGPFPTVEDAETYREHLNRSAGANAPDTPGSAIHRGWRRRDPLTDTEIVVGIPVWTRNGVNTLAAEIARGMLRAGLRARLVLTEEASSLVRVDEPRMPRPDDVPVDELLVPGPESWGARWGAMVHYLTSHSPCIYLPTYDWRHACTVPRLADDVAVVATVHEVSALYFDQLARIGSCCNAIVSASPEIAREVRAAFPGLQARMRTIPLGIDPGPDAPPRGPRDAGALRVLVMDDRLFTERTDPDPFWTDLAAPLEGTEFRRVATTTSDAPGADGTGLVVDPSSELVALCDWADVVVARVEKAAVPPELRLAMARGCVPVVMNEGGDQLFPLVDERNALVLPFANVDEVRSSVRVLASDRARLVRCARQAQADAWRGVRPLAQTIEDYLALFHRVRSEVVSGVFRRERGPIVPPPPEVAGTRVLPIRLEHVDPTLGAFPSAAEAAEYRRAAIAAAEPVVPHGEAAGSVR